ncbi:Putative AC transposase [Linum perenne]
MARDILAIPTTSVASESSFSLGGRVLSKWRTCIHFYTLEALMTTRNWLYGYKIGKSSFEVLNVVGNLLSSLYVHVFVNCNNLCYHLFIVTEEDEENVEDKGEEVRLT